MNSYLEQFTHLSVETELLEEASRMDKKSRKTDNIGIFSSMHSEIILEHFLKKTQNLHQTIFKNLHVTIAWTAELCCVQIEKLWILHKWISSIPSSTYIFMLPLWSFLCSFCCIKLLINQWQFYVYYNKKEHLFL